MPGQPVSLFGNTTVMPQGPGPVIYRPPGVFDFDIKINDAMPISGGYQGGNPVLICRALYRKKMHVGKLVFYWGTGKRQDACDIGVGNKEVVIKNNYELLFSHVK